MSLDTSEHTTSIADLAHNLLQLTLDGSPAGHTADALSLRSQLHSSSPPNARAAANDANDVTGCASTPLNKKYQTTTTTPLPATDKKDGHSFFLQFPLTIKSPDRTDKGNPYLKRYTFKLFGTEGVPMVSHVQQGKLNE